MFFSPHIFNQPIITAASISQGLTCPRLEYGQALLEWYEEISKIKQKFHVDTTMRHRITEQEIISCLRRGPMTTLELGRKIFGRSTLKRPIITILHKMANEGVIIRHQKNGDDIWELTRSFRIEPIVVPPIPA